MPRTRAYKYVLWYITLNGYFTSQRFCTLKEAKAFRSQINSPVIVLVSYWTGRVLSYIGSVL